MLKCSEIEVLGKLWAAPGRFAPEIENGRSNAGKAKSQAAPVRFQGRDELTRRLESLKNRCVKQLSFEGLYEFTRF